MAWILFLFNGEKIVILDTEIPQLKDFSEFQSKFQAAEIIKIDHKIGYIWIQTQEGILQINKLKPAGKKEMKARIV